MKSRYLVFFLVQAGAASKFLYFLENRNFGIGIPKLIRLTIGRPKEDIHMKEDHPKLNY